MIATGARAIPLSVPGAELLGVMSLRSAQEAKALKSALRPGATMAIIGGG